jgi:hypothetical protein
MREKDICHLTSFHMIKYDLSNDKIGDMKTLPAACCGH